MPLVKISVRDSWTSDRIKELNKAVHEGLVSALKIEDWDFFHRVYKFSKEDFVGIAPTDIFIQIIEQPNINWGIGGKARK